MKRGVKAGLLLAGLGLAVVVAGNRRSLAEGLRYLRQGLAWQPGSVKPVDPGGEFGLCYDLAGLDNAGRYELIARRLAELDLAPISIPVPGQPLPNLLVLLGGGPYTLFAAHYDKSRETPTYPAASDNTAAVAVLLAALRHLVSPPANARPGESLAPGSVPAGMGFLFTAAEEQGLQGARAFARWARAGGLAIDSIINFDMLGRGRLACRPSAPSGFYFRLPGWGELVYDGRWLRRGRPYPLPDPQLVAWLKAALGDQVVIYQRFAARSDSNVFQAAGWPTVCLSSDDMYYLGLVWHRDADRPELLDEDHLTLARRFVVGVALTPGLPLRPGGHKG